VSPVDAHASRRIAVIIIACVLSALALTLVTSWLSDDIDDEVLAGAEPVEPDDPERPPPDAPETQLNARLDPIEAAPLEADPIEGSSNIERLPGAPASPVPPGSLSITPKVTVPPTTPTTAVAAPPTSQLTTTAVPAPTAVPTTTSTTTTSSSTTTTTTTTVPPHTPAAWNLTTYFGLGAWVDVYDWSNAYTDGDPDIGLDEIEFLADHGVRTIYLQHGRWDHDGDLVDPERQRRLIDRAHLEGMEVVAWYLPALVDPEEDLRRILAATQLPFDGLAIDIETDVLEDVELRTRRQIELNAALRSRLGSAVMGGIVYAPVALELRASSAWPGYPWTDIINSYDVLLPMAYSTYRDAGSSLRDPAIYARANVDRLRELGSGQRPIHVVGGLAEGLNTDQAGRFVDASRSSGVAGWSVYDAASSSHEVTDAITRASG